MIDLLFQAGLSNACFAMLLAAVATVVGAKFRHPHLAHLLWVLVLVKLVTPPLMTMPVNSNSDTHEANFLPTTGLVTAHSEVKSLANEGTTISAEARLLGSIQTFWQDARYWIAAVWLLGSGIAFGRSMRQVHRFHRLLLSQTRPAPDHVQRIARNLSKAIGLKAMPEILQTSAAIAPLVWWVGGKVRIVVPDSIMNHLAPEEWRWVLAHELAHVRRRDYLVRWLEWLAGVCFWWNPAMWWAQKHLRATEEVCCDALVLSSLQPKPQTYATSIFKAVETLAASTFRPPAMASEINSGGNLERRFKMILSKSINEKTPAWLRTLAMASAVAVLPLGLATADENDYAAVEKRLTKSIKKGDITEEQAERMMAVLKEVRSEKIEKIRVDRKNDESPEKWDALRKKIREAVRAGELTREEAAAKVRLMRTKGMKRSDEKREQIRARLEAARTKFEAAVDAGKITKGEAKEKLRALRESIAHTRTDDGKEGAKGKPGAAEERMIGLRKRLGAAVEAGKLTEGEAKEKWEEIARQAKEKGKEMKEKVNERIKAALKAGKITEEEAKAKWEAVRKMAEE